MKRCIFLDCVVMLFSLAVFFLSYRELKVISFCSFFPLLLLGSVMAGWVAAASSLSKTDCEHYAQSCEQVKLLQSLL